MTADSLFAAILNIAADAIISIDERQNIVHYNQGAETIFGWTAAEAVGRPLDILIPERFRAVHRLHVGTFGASPNVARKMGHRREISGLRKNGEEFPADASISKLNTENGRLYTVVLRDISDRKRAEEEQRLLYQNAQKANRAREEILGVVSHDLQNPVSAIAMCAQALENLPDGNETTRKELASAIREATRWMKRMISDLLDVSSIEAGKLSMTFQPADVEFIVQSAIAMTEAMAQERSIAVTAEPLFNLPQIYADAERIGQSLVNLISNAIKFSSFGSTVTVCAATEDNHVVFSVTDSGSGIPEQNLPHIFNRYWQSRQAARRPGAGLGLAIVKGIAEAHGGQVWVESAVGKGSTFYFSIPCVANQ